MKLAVLYSGGKDSNFALHKVRKEGHEVVCLISMKSKNPESYMFQTPGNEFVKVQAEALDIPLIHIETEGLKEKELEDLKGAIQLAQIKFGAEGVVTGAIKSAYQSSRIQKICDTLNLWCINPLWQIKESTFMEELINEGFEILILGVYSYPLTQKYIGKIYTKELLKEFTKLRDKFGLSVAGEGGELETFILDSPDFKQRIKITDSKIIMDSENSGTMNIKKLEWVVK